MMLTRSIAALISAGALLTAGAAPNGVGPNLFAIGGTKAGAVPGFAFSPSMTKSGLTWNRTNLVSFIMEPQKTVPGTRMPFAGLKDRKVAEAVADYLLSLK
jgi:cytochrome c